ncbi:MAG TPA: dihydropteroate synthase [Thiothrix sp.]|nr:dihydropteroate synthase [Thiothrix sp.]
MGILNATPDSFSDGGQFSSLSRALEHVEAMQKAGVDIIDIGGESTRPNASPVSESEELQRVIPIIQHIRANDKAIKLSIDTSKAVVMQAAIDAGVDMVNDVRALQQDGTLAVCAASNVSVCLMHMQGQPDTMQNQPTYHHVVEQVKDFFQQRIHACENAGIDRSRLILDVGFGFGKTLEHNVQLLAELAQFKSFGLPLLAGISRKTMIGALLENAPVDQRLYGSLSAAVIACLNGASIIRVHDVKATVEALNVADAIRVSSTHPVS